MNIETEDKIGLEELPESFVDVDMLIECIQECCDKLQITTDFTFREQSKYSPHKRKSSSSDSYTTDDDKERYHLLKDFEALRKQYRAAIKEARKLYNSKEQEQTLCDVVQSYIYAPVINDEIRREISSQKSQYHKQSNPSTTHNASLHQKEQEENSNDTYPSPLPCSTPEERDIRRKVLLNTRRHPPIEENDQAIKEWKAEMERIDGVMALLTRNERYENKK